MAVKSKSGVFSILIGSVSIISKCMRSLSFSERSTQIHTDASNEKNIKINGPELLPDFLDVIHKNKTIYFSEDNIMFISSLVSNEMVFQHNDNRHGSIYKSNDC